MLTIRQLFLQYQAQTSGFPLAVEIERAEGVYLFGSNGEKYLDLISGISVSNIGHRHPAVLRAIHEQLEKYLHVMVYGEYVQLPQVKLAEKLVQNLSSTLNCVYFVNSGTEATEGAMKLAKRYTGRAEIISCINAYHGSTQGALSLMGSEIYKQGYYPLIPSVKNIRFNSFQDLDNITDQTAAVFVEPVQGEAGVISPVDGYLEAIRQRCNETGTLLVFDEIQTGFGRTGKLFAFQKFNIFPDIILIAKGMGGGMPIGAFIASKSIMECLTENPVLGHITTFGGHPVSCVASLASLNVLLESTIISTVQKKEKLFLELLVHPKIREVRSNGLLLAIELGSFEAVQSVIKLCIEKGVLVDWFLFCNTAIRVAPPLTISDEEIKKAVEVILSTLSTI